MFNNGLNMITMEQSCGKLKKNTHIHKGKVNKKYK